MELCGYLVNKCKGVCKYDYSCKKGSKIFKGICKIDIWNKRLMLHKSYNKESWKIIKKEKTIKKKHISFITYMLLFYNNKLLTNLLYKIVYYFLRNFSIIK